MNTEARNANLLTEPELMDWLGYKRRTELQAALRKLGIPFATGRGGSVVSTVQAVNSGLLNADVARMGQETIEF